MTLPRSVRESVVITVIVINSIAIFWRAFPDVPPTLSTGLFVMDYGCTVYFLYEVVVKLRAAGRTGYFSTNWNRFDFAVVMVSLPMLLSPLFDVNEDFSVVLLLRLARLLRFFRLMRFIPDVERVFAGVRRGLKASIGVFLALALYNFALGLAACYLFRGVAPEHFGDPLLSLYSMFKVFTVEGWFEIPDTVALHHPTWAVFVRGFFMFAVATGGLLGLSMANAVFVDEMVIDNNRELERQVAVVTAQLDTVMQQNQALLDRWSSEHAQGNAPPPEGPGPG